MEIKSFAEIRDAMRNYMAAHQDRLTDFNDGSVIESYIEAAARETAMLYIRCRVGFSSYLRSLPYSVFGFERKNGQKASVKVVFSRSKPFPGDTVIAAGAVVSAGGLRFLTTRAGAVPSGETASDEITASAEEAGEKYNIGAGQIKKIVSALPADIVAVNNPASASGGTDGEDWSAYIGRFSDYILGLSRTNGYGFRSALMSAGAARSLSFEEHFPPLDGIWNMTVYLEDGSGGMTGEAMAEAKGIIDGNMKNTNNGGYRAPGINIRYLAPETVPVNIKLAVTANAEDDTVSQIDVSLIVSEVSETAKKTVNSLGIGEMFWTSSLIVALRGIEYLLDVDVEEPGDIEIGINQIARFGSCDVRVIIK